MIGLTIFTVFLKENKTNNFSNGPEMTENGGNGQAPPEMPNGGNSNNQGQPPEMQNGNDTNRPGPPPEMQNGGGTNTPGQPPEMQNGGGTNNPGHPPEMQQASTPIYFYIIFFVEGAIISLIITYLIMSKFNKKSIKEVFISGDKITIFILFVLILTCAITAAASIVKLPNKDQTMDMNGNQNINYNSANEITNDQTVNNQNFNSTTADENAVTVSGKINVTMNDSKITKTGDSNGGDTTSFYGTNSAIIAKDGATLTINNSTIETNANGANGVFSYGGSAKTNNTSSDGTTINIKNSTIVTEKDSSGGIMTTGGGTTNAENLTIKTSGMSSAAIRSDRGGGTVVVNKGTYSTSGQGSPAIYSTADITVKSATLISTTSEGIVIEGKNKVTLEKVNLTDNNIKLHGQSTTYKNIFLYQSMSGDADEGVAEFTSKDSTITTEKGDTFYITNTTAKIKLENNKIINNDPEGNFLRAKNDSWGNSGSNGGNVTLEMNNQSVEGNIVIDEISTLKMSLSSKSVYVGNINSNNMAKEIELSLDKNSKIKLTADSYVTKLTDADKSYSNIDFNGYKLYVNGKAIN